MGWPFPWNYGSCSLMWLQYINRDSPGDTWHYTFTFNTFLNIFEISSIMPQESLKEYMVMLTTAPPPSHQMVGTTWLTRPAWRGERLGVGMLTAGCELINPATLVLTCFASLPEWIPNIVLYPSIQKWLKRRFNRRRNSVIQTEDYYSLREK